jgi:hypothetical protein
VLIFGVAAIGRNCLRRATSDVAKLSSFNDSGRSKIMGERVKLFL